MDFKSMLQQLSQLSEGTQETEKGRVHKAEPGGYGRKFDTDEEGDEKKDDKKKAEPAVKRGRGRPPKTGEHSKSPEEKEKQEKREKAGQYLQSYVVGNLPGGKAPGKKGTEYGLSANEKQKKKDEKAKEKAKTKKSSLKEWVQEIENKYVAEGQLDELSPATLRSYSDKARNQAERAAGIVKYGGQYDDYRSQEKPQYRDKLVTDPDVDYGPEDSRAKFSQKRYAGANRADAKLNDKRVKEAAPGQQLTVKPMPGAAQLVDPATQKVMATGDAAAIKNVQGAVAQGKVQMRGEEMAESDEDYSATKARAGKDIGKPGKQFSKIAKSAGEKYGSKERGEKVAGAVLAKLRKKVSEADIPSDQSDMGAGLGAARSNKTFEGKKPDFPDIDDDGNTKEPISKAAQDAEKKPKKKVSESVHKHNAARLLGKHHALAKEAYNCKYDDMEEARLYHEGYKEGLDECYGQMPVQGLVSENPMPATTPGMASAAMPPAMEEDMFDEGNAFTKFLATHDKGETGTVGGRTVTDTSSYDADVDESFMAFESWDKELNALLNEGMTVSISKGQQGMPDSVSVSAQDAEADQLLGLIKQAGMGLFGGEDKPQGFAADVTGMSAGGEEEGRDSDDIGVVDDHDGMMALIKKVVGGHQEPEEVGAGSDEGHDYEGEDGDEEHDHEGHDHDDEEVNEAQCNECGMMESKCECESEQVEEVQSYDQEEYVVAEDNAPDSDEAETTADENAEAAEDSALAKADELKEWANEAGKKGTDESFETDINFITRVLAGGLNKEKSTGQTTVPVIAGQNDRMGYSVKNESISDWKKLAGLK